MDSGLSLLLSVLPLALGAAMSPTVLTVQILVLASGPRALWRGWALAAGRMTMLFLFSFTGLSLLSRLPDFSTGQASWAEVIVSAVAGVLLLLIAYWEWLRRDRPHRQSKLGPRLARANPIYLFAFGAGWMLVNASTLALFIPALHVISSSAAGDVWRLLAFLVLYLLTSAVVLVPALVVTIYGDRAQTLLHRLHLWTEKHSHMIVLAVTIGFGVGLICFAAWTATQLA